MADHVRTTIRYDGPALSGHEMDVQDLAPALLALADIIQTANRRFNGESASIKVLVNADIEHKCFQLDLSLVQSILDQAKIFLAIEDVKTAKEIADWIGLGITLGGGLFGLLKLMAKRPAGTELKIEAHAGSTVTIFIGATNAVTVPREVYDLALDPAIIKKMKDVVSPLEKTGYESLTFLENGREIQSFTQKDARDILAYADELSPPPEDSVSVIHGPIRIRTPQYEGAAKWRVLWGGRPIDVTMPKDWVRQFQNNEVEAPPNTTLDVKIEQRVPLDEDGEAKGQPSYTVIEVINVTHPQRRYAQEAMF